MCEPIKPKPPVTKIFIFYIFSVGGNLKACLAINNHFFFCFCQTNITPIFINGQQANLNSFIHKNNSFNPEVSTPIFKTNLDVQLIIIPLILLFSSLSLNYLINKETETWILILSQLPFALFLLITFLIGKISNTKPLFTLSKDGITFKTETFSWDYYLGFTVEKELNRRNRTLYIQFHFIGNSCFLNECGISQKQLSLNNCKVWGERSDVDTFMRAGDLFMFNSTWECNPLVLREATSYGLKILSRNLEQYMDMFTPYITEIDGDITSTKYKIKLNIDII